MGEIVSIVSPGGGAGKSTLAINLAVALNDMGKDICLVDAHFSNPSVAAYLGYPSLKNTFQKALTGMGKIEKSVYVHPSGVRIVPGESRGFAYSLPVSYALERLLSFHHNVIVDSSNALSAEAIAVSETAHKIIAVTRADHASVIQLRKVMGSDAYKGRVSGIVVNMAHGDRRELSAEEIEELTGEKVIGIIPYDEAVRESIHMKHPLLYTHPTSQAASEIRKISKLL